MQNRILTIASVLPHSGPMRLLEELVDYGAEHVSCAVTIRPHSVFCDGSNGVPSWVGMEYMAQTAAAYAGIEDAWEGRRPSVCLLLGTRQYQANTAWFPIGAQLRVVANLLMRDENDLVAFDCEIYHGSSLLARGDLKALRPRDIRAFVRTQRAEEPEAETA